MRDSRGRPLFRSPMFWVPFVLTLVTTMALLNPDLMFALLASPDILLGVTVVSTVSLVAYSRHLDRQIEENEREMKRLEDEIKYWRQYKKLQSERSYWKNKAEEEQ